MKTIIKKSRALTKELRHIDDAISYLKELKKTLNHEQQDIANESIWELTAALIILIDKGDKQAKEDIMRLES